MIEVGRNSIVVRNVDKKSESFRKIQYKYSLYDKVTHKYTFSAYIENDGDLYFPSSITIEEIQACFPEEEVAVNFKNTAKAQSILFNMIHQPKNDLQKKSIQFLMKMKNDLETHQRFLSLETGSGKTYVTINIISKFKKKAMIVVDGVSLANQWKEEFLKHTDLKDEDIVILSGQESIDSEFAKPKGKIYIAIHRTLGNLISNDINSINSLMNKLGIGIRVFDESHVEFGNICRINSLSNVEYTLYLTATPSRSNFNDNSLYAKVFGKVPYFNGKELSGDKYHTVVMYSFNSHPGLDDKISVRTKYGFNQAKWSQYIENDGYQYLLEAINEIITKFKLGERNMKVAMMFPTIELIKKVKKDIEELFPDVFTIGMFIGEVPKDKRFEELEKTLILTNDKIFDKAIDVQDLEILINFVPIGSLVKTEQIIGRLRNRPNYQSILIDVCDNGFDECIRNTKLRKRFYKKKAKKIIEIKN